MVNPLPPGDPPRRRSVARPQNVIIFWKGVYYLIRVYWKGGISLGRKCEGPPVGEPSLPCPALPRPAMSRLAMPALTCPALPCLAQPSLPCRAVPPPALPRPIAGVFRPTSQSCLWHGPLTAGPGGRWVLGAGARLRAWEACSRNDKTHVSWWCRCQCTSEKLFWNTVVPY